MLRMLMMLAFIICRNHGANYVSGYHDHQEN